MARMVAISRLRSETAEYMVLSAPKIAPNGHDACYHAAENCNQSGHAGGLLSVIIDFAADVYIHARIGGDGIFELLQGCWRSEMSGGGLKNVRRDACRPDRERGNRTRLRNRMQHRPRRKFRLRSICRHQI